MTSRATYYRNSKKHAQREFGATKAPLAKRDTDTTWMPEFVSSLQGLTTSFNADSIIAAQLGETVNQRVIKLRALSKLGVLHMYALREQGEFVEYRWRLTERGTL